MTVNKIKMDAAGRINLSMETPVFLTV